MVLEHAPGEPRQPPSRHDRGVLPPPVEPERLAVGLVQQAVDLQGQPDRLEGHLEEVDQAAGARTGRWCASPGSRPPAAAGDPSARPASRARRRSPAPPLADRRRPVESLVGSARLAR